MTDHASASGGTHHDAAAALRDLAERYAAGVDRRDTGLFSSVFAPDASLLVFDPADSPHPTGARRGREQLTDVITRVGRHDRTFHLLGNSRYDIDGDHATGEVYCVAHHVDRVDGSDAPPAATDHVMYIRYLDRYERTGGAWLIHERRVLVEWTETHPVELGTANG